MYNGRGGEGSVRHKAWQAKRGLQLTCWNCRGLSSSLPYLEALMKGGSKVLVLSEHWLWPYELHKLNQLGEEYEAVGRQMVHSQMRQEGEGVLWC